MRTANQMNETNDVIKERRKKSKLGIDDIIVPILVFIVLILLSVFVFIPMVNSAIGFRRESKEINTQMENLEDLESGLGTLDTTMLQADLIVAKKVIPNTLKVSNFIYYIDSLANEKGLSSTELTASDVKVVTGGDRDNPDYTYAVNGPLAYRGSFEEVLDFLDDLQLASPYIVSLEDISMNGGQTGIWNLSLTVTGYYIPDEVQDINLYLPFSAYTKYEDTMGVLRQKAEKLED